MDIDISKFDQCKVLVIGDLMLDEYYAARGWDVATGAPSREKLAELNIEYVADQLT